MCVYELSDFGYEVLAMCLFVLQVRLAGETGLKGVIKGSGILCYCAKCKIGRAHV